MKDLKKLFRKYGIIFLGLIFIMMLIFVLYDNQENAEQTSKKDDNSEKNLEEIEDDEASEREQWVKGYDLPIENQKKEEVEADCIKIMDSISGIYRNADKGEASNVVLSDETLEQMQAAISENGYPVITSEEYCTMSNYEKMDQFLKE